MSPVLKLKSFIVERLEGTRAYIPLQTAYRKLFDIQNPVLRRNFYSQFVGRTSLVFDVGANYGEYSHTFLDLGAKVIAIEPNPSCARILARHHNNQLTVRCEAVGEREDQATLFVGARTGHSTLSPEWMTKAVKTGTDHRWKDTVVVPITTLNRLQEEYGRPNFIKVDVEGYEASVFRGMSFRPNALGFEFHACALEQLRECLSLPVFEAPCSLNIVLGYSWQFVWSDWRNKEAVLDYAAKLPAHLFGDVYVKFEE